jgi:hypothetical protein
VRTLLEIDTRGSTVEEVVTSERRSRCVIFRVTEREYNCLKSASEAGGHGNLSDYARSGLLGGSHDGNDGALWQRFLEMDQKVTELHQLMTRVFEALHAGNSLHAIPPAGESNENK